MVSEYITRLTESWILVGLGLGRCIHLQMAVYYRTEVAINVHLSTDLPTREVFKIDRLTSGRATSQTVDFEDLTSTTARLPACRPPRARSSLVAAYTRLYPALAYGLAQHPIPNTRLPALIEYIQLS
ncbi:hypothetical protein NEUTE1DRAFT_108347 [Neurospora tetrasperma FGSC 2508]|uniref:Uncharacterized protein n=1 Tax=Neurospora tetrasperma (strain FGSC 2508 / ATCC MYA-4615 / P0657) TaxID=510951 RepID=F8MH99_NEUT8|nr:uncharacterized protein NEUTE1DRAFT_108347 [Neurospora tetrasperma FGSC 2508]EGO58764.1 hypothetical protein NEUTE1DRAFT_108347 [Neurospora tetrasperma FGSC 2508]